MITDNEKRNFENLGIKDVRKLYCEYRFRFRPELEEIGVKIYENMSGEFETEVSHFIKTPAHASAYFPTSVVESDAEAALHRAVQSLSLEFKKGDYEVHTPVEEWFIRNETY